MFSIVHCLCLNGCLDELCVCLDLSCHGHVDILVSNGYLQTQTHYLIQTSMSIEVQFQLALFCLNIFYIHDKA